MMLRKESNAWARLKVLPFVPLVAGMLLAFSQPEMKQKAEAVLQQDQPASVVEQVQENPFFYWEEVQRFCTEKGISPKDLEIKPGSDQLKRHMIVLINSVNQALVQSKVSTEYFKIPEEINSTASLQTLKKMIMEVMSLNDPEPIIFTLQQDDAASTRFVFSFLYSTLPMAYQAALDEVSKRDGLPVDRLMKEKPLLLVNTIPMNYSGNAYTDEPKEGGKGKRAFIRTSVMENGIEANLLSSAQIHGEEEDMKVVSLRHEFSPKRNGDDSTRREKVIAVSGLETGNLTLVSVRVDMTADNMEDIKTVVSKKIEPQQSIYVLSM